MKFDIWHVTWDMWNMPCDMWHVWGGGVNIPWFMIFWRFGGKGCKGCKNSFPKKDRSYKSVLTSELIFSKLCEANIGKNLPIYSQGFSWQNIHLEFGYFLLLTPVGKAQQSQQNLKFSVILLLSQILAIHQQ